MEKKKKLIILGVIVLILAISGLTYAILTWTSTKINLGLNSGCFTIDYTKGQDISGNLKLINVGESFDGNDNFVIKEGMGLSYANLGIKSSCTIEGYGSLYLNVTTLSDSFKEGGDSNGALGYALLRNTSNLSNDKLTIENLKGQSFEMIDAKPITNTGTIKLVTEQLSNTELNKYLIVIFVDSVSAGNSITSATFQGNISAAAEQGTAPVSIALHIIDLYDNSVKTTVTNNGIDYEYDTVDGLMLDIGDNIRYYGETPNNYIYFNCSDYSNQTTDTCELWRIIGVFNNQNNLNNGNMVKIIRNDSIGEYSWDNKDRTTGAENDYGKNDWTDARLMKLLNPGYDNETIGGSLYWNSGSGTCYKSWYNKTDSCDFTSIGLKNDITREMIEEVIYYLGGLDDNIVYPDYAYNAEMGKKVYTGRTTRWIGKVGLAYMSDYGYSVDLSKCSDTLNSFGTDMCKTWLYENDIGNFAITPFADRSYAVYAFGGGAGYIYAADYDRSIRPVIFLNSKREIKSGDGSESTPYQLKVN